VFLLCVCKPGPPRPRAQVASHQACVASCRQLSQLSSTQGEPLQLLPPSSDQCRDSPSPIQCKPWEDGSWTRWLDAGQGWRRAACRAPVSAKKQFHCCLTAAHRSISVADHEKACFSCMAAKHSPKGTLCDIKLTLWTESRSNTVYLHYEKEHVPVCW